MHVTGLEPIECTRGDKTTMHGSVRRERMVSRLAEGIVPKYGKGRARRADGEGSSQVEEPEYKPQVEKEVQVEGDVEA